MDFLQIGDDFTEVERYIMNAFEIFIIFGSIILVCIAMKCVYNKIKHGRFILPATLNHVPAHGAYFGNHAPGSPNQPLAHDDYTFYLLP